MNYGLGMRPFKLKHRSAINYVYACMHVAASLRVSCKLFLSKIVLPSFQKLGNMMFTSDVTCCAELFSAALTLIVYPTLEGLVFAPWISVLA